MTIPQDYSISISWYVTLTLNG